MIARRLYAAVLVGVLFYFILGLEPVAWLAWFAPVPLLVLAFRSSGWGAAACTFIAAVIGLCANLHYYRLMMPWPVIALVICLQALMWVFVVGATRRVVLRYQSWWTIFVYPVLWAAVDTLAANLLPDTNWGSLAYSQTGFLPLLQVTSLFGVAGLMFLLALLPSTLAVAVAFGRQTPHMWRAYAAVALIFAAALGYGDLRLRQPVSSGTAVNFGIVAIDDAIGTKASPEYVAKIWNAYDAQIAQLAASGAQVVVLPEKIGMVTPETATAWQQHVSAQAAALHVWIAAGVGIDDAGKRTNLEWLYGPDGHLDAAYSKHKMAPPEREQQYISGTGYDVREIAGVRYGLAICKDMHFASMGRAYGERSVSAMLVPAWDFDRDRWLAFRITMTRGVESGYTVIRSSRDGLLSVTDAYGRVLAVRESAPLPGSSLLVKATIAPPIATLYTRIGDLFGWICVALSAAMMLIGRRWKSATAQPNPEPQSTALAQ